MQERDGYFIRKAPGMSMLVSETSIALLCYGAGLEEMVGR